MKKILSIALAVVMMLAVCVPAFAVDIVMPDDTGDTMVKVDPTTVEDAKTYTVSIPAEVVVAWGAENTANTYDVVTHLGVGEQLKVNAVKVQDMKFADADDLVFSISGDVTDVLVAAVDTVTKNFSVDIAKDTWSAAPVAEYTNGQITFTVEIV